MSKGITPSVLEVVPLESDGLLQMPISCERIFRSDPTILALEQKIQQLQAEEVLLNLHT